jgi:aminoglycoside phosphotransferase (APT) family kinase protein
MDNNIALYTKRLNLQNATFTRIDHADAMVATVYKVTLPTNEQLILKICKRTRHYYRELYFLTHFADTLPVPRIIQVVEPTDGIDGAILMQYLEGNLLTQTDLTNELMYEAGSILARVHLNRTAGYGDLIHPDSLNPDPQPYFVHKFNEALTECKNHLPQTFLEQCQNYLDTHLDLLLNVDGPCITHRDFRRGNLIAHNGKINGIIDWSGAYAGFAQEDFCFLEYGNIPIDPIHKQSFLDGYASIRPVPEYNAIMPLLLFDRALALVGFTFHQGTWQNIHADTYHYNRQFLDNFFLNSEMHTRANNE